MMGFRITRIRSIVASVATMLVVATSLSVSAVTRQEMEKAQATAALWYLRYANNGSDYLEKLNPSTVAELEQSLKSKERENIKAFKAVAVPTDYASWDKAKLVEYWSGTFFKSTGLDVKGTAARTRVKGKLQAMEISSPESKVAESPGVEESPAKDPAAIVDAAQETLEFPTAQEVMEQTADSAANDSLSAASDAAVENDGKKNSSTWIYIIALVILVGVVIWLVIFASKTMQNSDNKNSDNNKKDGISESEEDDDHPLMLPVREKLKTPDYSADYSEEDEVDEEDEVLVVGSDSKLREKFARAMAVKDEEIRSLHREIHDLRNECLKLGEENGRLNSDLTLARRELDALQGRLKAASAVTNVAGAASSRSMNATSKFASKNVSATRTGGDKREIFLGRVNSKGIFVRADKHIVAEKTVFVLSTSDGYTGSFRVVQDADVISRVLDNPEYYLAGGCVAQDINDTDEARGIKTINAGTAVFESGCWRVARKSKITYL